jgi:DNA excision repair protein ERCC-2
VRIAVRDLAAFAGRAGDLHSSLFSLLRGTDGIRAHRRIQKNRPGNVRTEVPLNLVWEELELYGRADLVEETEAGTVLEEIKTTRLAAEETHPDFPAHRLQARIYAWMWLRLHGTLPAVLVRYVPPDRGEGTVVDVSLPEAELDREITAVLARYQAQQKEQQARIADRNAALAEMTFPFDEIRPGQTELMRQVEAVFSGGGRLYAEAPTGIGKTLAVLYPALKALGRGEIDVLLAATCRNTGKNVFEEAFAHLRRAGGEFRALTLVARDRICNQAGTPCDCGACPLALGFYDRLEQGLAALRAEADWSREVWMRIAAEHRLCPYAFQMHAVREADVILGDVNFALDPGARLAFLFETAPERVGLLIDEAHHLPERARDMYSARLPLTEIARALRTLPAEQRNLANLLRRVGRAAKALEMSERNGIRMTEAPPREVAEACRQAGETLEQSLAESPAGPGDVRMDLLRAVQGFWMSVERHQSVHATYWEQGTLVHFCRDPAETLAKDLDALRAAVLFSATLQPMESFRRLTGSQRGLDRELILASPFDRARFRVEREYGIPVVWRSRGPGMYDKLAERIRRFLEANPGKTLVYLPSYSVLEEVRQRLPADDLWMGPVLVPPRGLQEEEARAFLEPFRTQSGPLTALTVLGGVLNEGIDLPGDALTGVVVVGIGLPGVEPGRELLRAWHQERGEDGFAMAYTHPGLCRVRQALGRVIRGPGDRGQALLIDPRFEHPLYRDI